MFLSEAKALKPGDKVKHYSIVDANNEPTVWVVESEPETYWYNPFAVKILARQDNKKAGATKYRCVFNQRDVFSLVKDI